MAYLWVADLPPGAAATPEDVAAVGLERRFPNQQDAEQWLAACYPDLVDLGVRSVSLFEEDRLVYGPMSLVAE